MSLDGTDHHGLISSPQLYLIEKKGEFVLATKNPFYFDPKNPIQDLMQKGFELNTTYITPHLREALMQEADRRFHFTLRERFFFHSSESEQFYHDIQDHVMVLQPKQGLTRLQAGQTLFSLSPQLLLKKVQDACQENLMRGYIESNETINLEYLRQLHRNATQYLARLGVEWSNQNTSILNTSQFIAALNDPKNKKFLPQKPIIFYEKVINEQNLEELKPFIYLPPHLLEQARESQTGNVIATTLARFPNTMTPEDMLLALPEESSVRKQLSRFLENNPRTRRALTQAAHHAQREELESGSKTEDSMMLSFPIRALRYSLVSEGDIQLAADQEAESADLVSTKGSISIESTASRVQDGAHFHDSLTDRRSLKMRGHLELRAGQDIHLKAIQAHAGSFGAEAQGSVTDQPILLQSYSEKSSPGLQEKRFESRATPSEFDVQGQMRIRGHQMTLQGTHIQAEELQLKSDEQMRILGIIESEQTARSTEESTGALFWKGKRVKHESASHQRFRPAEFRVTRKVEIHGKEAILEAPHLHAPETLIEADTARILQGKSTSETSDYKNSSNPFWVSMNASQQKHESHTPLQSSGHVKIKATKLEIEKVNGQVLDFLDHLEFNPSQVEVVHRQLSELHHRDHQSVSAPGPALVTAVAVTVSVLTAGSGTPVAAAVSAKLGAAIGSMTGAAVSAITSQVTTQVVLGVLSQSSPREMLKQLTSKDALKSLATSVVSAGALHCVQSVQAATHTSPFVCEIENAATQATVGAGIGLALGDQEFGDLLQGAGIQLVSQLGSSTVS
ncbi:hypothetical protein EBS43_09235, partial [bacterium]|nr:hypothetical protein [bacterium]